MRRRSRSVVAGDTGAFLSRYSPFLPAHDYDDLAQPGSQSAMALPAATKVLDYLINHVAFPPQLPPSHESSFKTIGHAAILDRMLTATKAFREKLEVEHYQPWTSMHRTISNYRLLHSGDYLAKDALKDALKEAKDGGILLVLRRCRLGLGLGVLVATFKAIATIYLGGRRMTSRQKEGAEHRHS